MAADELPSGTVALLFTDIEGSTRLVQALGDAYPAILRDHLAILERAVEDAGGRVFGTEGDAVFAVFAAAPAAIRAGADAQRALAAHAWPAGGRVRVRIGIHAGPVERFGDGYVGLSLHQAARIASAGHGGQVLVSEAARALAADGLPGDLAFVDLGAHRLKDLAHPERLFQLVGPGLETGFPALRSLDVRPNNLPVQLTTFVGRDELAVGRERLERTRLLTLTGPGGTGKTRLALQLAAEAADRFPDGVYFVALDAIEEPELIPSAIAAAVALEPGSDPPLDRLLAWLPGRRLLLVLDNLEQVVAGAPVIGRLLAASPDLTILATSRILLRIAGEQELAVPPLGVPAAGEASPDAAGRSEAVRLFVERAMSAQPSFRLDAESAPDVVEIVRRLDGLPLAIELAAARVRILSVSALRSRLDQRLALLTGGPRDRPTRQQTLRGAIDWSHDLLDEPERRLFRRVGVFAGGLSLPEAEPVCGPPSEIGGEVFDGLADLAEKSLIRPAEDHGEPRFEMLATIREYALERLAESREAEAIGERHARAYLELAEAAAGHLTGPDSRAWLDRLEADHDNLRAAVDRAVEHGDAEIALRLLAALWRFWQIRGHLVEAADRADRILSMAGIEGADPRLLARGWGARGGIAYWRGDLPTTADAYRRALEAARRSGDRRTLADALYDAGYAPFADRPDPTTMRDEGLVYFDEAAAVYRELGDDRGLASVEWAIGVANTFAGRHDEALGHVTRALAAYRAVDDRFGEGWALHMIGLNLAKLGDLDASERRFREALDVFGPYGDLSAILIVLVDLGLVADRLGDPERATRLGGAAHAIRNRSGSDLLQVSGEAIGWPVPEPPDPADAERARWWAEGLGLSIEVAIELARQPTRRSSPDRSVETP